MENDVGLFWHGGKTPLLSVKRTCLSLFFLHSCS